MDPLIALLTKMRGREPLYLGSRSVLRLGMFLRGYQAALLDLNAAHDGTFLSKLNDRIRNRFQVPVSRSWDEILGFCCANDDEALKVFWETFDAIVM